MTKRKRTIARSPLYRSGLEKEIATQLKNNKTEYSYEPAWGKISYIIPAKNCKYLPDFYITTKSGKQIIIEAKGIWVFTDRLKHYLIRKMHPKLDIRFVFSNPKSKIRKGSKTTYAHICEGKGRGMFKDIKWKYATKKIPQSWLDE